MPWLHVKALKELSDKIDVTCNSSCHPAIAQFFEANKSSFPVMAELSLRPPPPIFERLAMACIPNGFQRVLVDLIEICHPHLTFNSPKTPFTRSQNFLQFSDRLHLQ